MDTVLAEIPLGARTVDLGAGSGALVARLLSCGAQATGVDVDPHRFKVDAPFVLADLDDEASIRQLDEGAFDLVTAVEVIEHMERPIGFLRSLSRLLSPEGRAVITTPNLDSAAARAKFMVKGKLRMMDEIGDPTHISPIFFDLLTRQYLPRAGLTMEQHVTYPARGFLSTRRPIALVLRMVLPVLSGPALQGDTHIFVLRRDPRPPGIP